MSTGQRYSESNESSGVAVTLPSFPVALAKSAGRGLPNFLGVYSGSISNELLVQLLLNEKGACALVVGDRRCHTHKGGRSQNELSQSAHCTRLVGYNEELKDERPELYMCFPFKLISAVRRGRSAPRLAIRNIEVCRRILRMVTIPELMVECTFIRQKIEWCAIM